ncbi:MAG: 30S ribosomal protein S16 [Patescibacteria group bacterium]
MVSIRLQRIGRKKLPHFRLIVQDKQKDPWDKSLEILGSIDPRTKEISLKKDRIEYWLSVGAQPTNTVRNLLIEQGIIKGEKAKTINISKKRTAKKEGDKTEEKVEEAKEDKPESKEEVKEEKKEEVEQPKKEEKTKEKKAE